VALRFVGVGAVASTQTDPFDLLVARVDRLLLVTNSETRGISLAPISFSNDIHDCTTAPYNLIWEEESNFRMREAVRCACFVVTRKGLISACNSVHTRPQDIVSDRMFSCAHGNCTMEDEGPSDSCVSNEKNRMASLRHTRSTFTQARQEWDLECSSASSASTHVRSEQSGHSSLSNTHGGSP
jgi:hypothetical protein